MSGNGANFDHEKEQAIAGLLFRKNVEAAGLAVEIGLSCQYTIRRELPVARQTVGRTA